MYLPEVDKLLPLSEIYKSEVFKLLSLAED